MSLARNDLEAEGTNTICEALKVNNTLKELDLSGRVKSNIGGPAGAKHVADMLGVNVSLTSITLLDNQLGDEGWCAIFDALRGNPQSKIVEWNLSGEGINPTTVESLAAYVALSGSLTCQDGKKVFKAKLLSAKCKHCGLTQDEHSMKGSLMSINLSENVMGPDGARALAPAIAATGSLTKLSLARNMLEEEGTKSICEALNIKQILKELDLSGSYNGSSIGGPAGAKHVADMLTVNRSLTSLDLTSRTA
jgi:Ran GTPase-activating protein (RanGAP) involved in mRNA processing and transport